MRSRISRCRCFFVSRRLIRDSVATENCGSQNPVCPLGGFAIPQHGNNSNTTFHPDAERAMPRTEMQFSPTACAPGATRRFMRDTLATWRLGEFGDVSELL